MEVVQSQGRYRPELRVSPAGRWSIAAIEPHGGVARRSTRFQLATPTLGQEARSPLRLTGSARVEGGQFWVELEDGHNILAQQRVRTVASDRAWGTFDLALAFEQPTSPHGTLLLGVGQPNGVDRDEDLMVPLDFVPYNRSASQAVRSPSSVSEIWWAMGYSR